MFHTQALEALAEGLVGRLRPALDAVARASYTLGEAEYVSSEAGDGWVARLLGALEASMGWLGPLLTSRNSEALLQVRLVAHTFVVRER